MNARMKGTLRAAFAATLLASGAALAGGPLGLCSSIATKYPGAGNVALNYDLGTLGSRTNAAAATIVTNAISKWTNVTTSTLNLTRGADLGFDVTTANYSGLYNNFTDGINPVIYDTDGSLTDLLLGAGAKSGVLGFAGSAYWSGVRLENPNYPGCTYAEGRAVINGYIAISDDTMTNVLTHEIGHLIGMDHTQIDGTQGLATSNYPIMYPVAYRTLTTLHEDDAAALTALYPESASIVNAAYGSLTGNFVTAALAPIAGANIWVQGTGGTFSVVSDYLMQGNGTFRFLLPPGTYTLHAEAVETSFKGGSRVGPFSSDWYGASFQPPLYAVGGGVSAPSGPMTPVALGGGAGTQFTITAGCAATATFTIAGGGTILDCQPTAPATPVPISPVGAITTTTPPFVFTAVANATSYAVEVWGPAGLTASYSATPAEAGCFSNTGSCSIASTVALTNGTAYSWRMKAYNNALASAYSGWVSFNVALAASPPAVPTPLAPSGSISTSTPDFLFVPVANATTYAVEAWGSAGLAASYSVTPAQAGCPTNTGVCAIASTIPLANGGYSWRMRALNGSAASGYTGWMNFTVAIVPAVPVPISPTGTITTASPQFLFNPAFNATSYTVEVWGPAGLAASYSATPAQALCAANSGVCQIASTVALTNGTSYSWRMKALNGTLAGGYTGWVNFTVSIAPPTPVAISPVGTITTGTPSFLFNPSTTATSYAVEVWGAAGLAASYSATPTQAGCPSNTGVCAIASTVTLASGAYSWRMRALNAAQGSAYTGWVNFTVSVTPSTPTPISPVGTIGTNMPAFLFSAAANATSYNVEVWGPAGLAASYTATPSQAACPTNSGVCAISSTVPLGNAGYSWRMRALNGSNSSAYTGWMNFTVSIAATGGGGGGI